MGGGEIFKCGCFRAQVLFDFFHQIVVIQLIQTVEEIDLFISINALFLNLFFDILNSFLVDLFVIFFLFQQLFQEFLLVSRERPSRKRRNRSQSPCSLNKALSTAVL